MARPPRPLSSRELLSRIGLSVDAPHALVLGVIWDQEPGRGEFTTFHFDSRRFQPWQE